MNIKVVDNGIKRIVRSEDYNYTFNYSDGFFARWGKTLTDDPQIAPFPEILDIEITTKCKGPGGKLCSFCYKSNSSDGDNMSFDTFKTIIDKMKMRNDIEIELDDGNILVLKPNDVINTNNGKKLVMNLLVTDERVHP